MSQQPEVRQGHAGSGTDRGDGVTSISLGATARRHPSTIVFGVAAVVLAAVAVIALVRIGGSDTGATFTVLRLGGLAVIACLYGGPMRLLQLRRRDQRRALGAEHPGVAFVTARPTATTRDDLGAWNPGLQLTFPCQLAFSAHGIATWETETDAEGQRIAGRAEVLSIEPFHTPNHSWEQPQQGWGIVLHLAPRDGVSASKYTGEVHLWIEDEQTERDEYAAKQSIRVLMRALGPANGQQGGDTPAPRDGR